MFRNCIAFCDSNYSVSQLRPYTRQRARLESRLVAATQTLVAATNAAGKAAVMGAQIADRPKVLGSFNLVPTTSCSRVFVRLTKSAISRLPAAKENMKEQGVSLPDIQLADLLPYVFDSIWLDSIKKRDTESVQACLRTGSSPSSACE